ncbi:MAG: amidohydrolase [Anaerolineae bacterium]|nr:amidohydrolase [Anaerolineae bacterium]
MTFNMVERALTLEDQIIAWRRDFHQHPELGFKEFRTAGVVARELNAMGVEVTTGVGKTGVVGIIGDGGPVVGIRADMDALPILEANQVEYASKHDGVMHACGHDAHTAILLGVARMLVEMPDRPKGQIRLLFQPCEETEGEDGYSGAWHMIKDGALDGVDKVIALHVASDMPAGKIAINPGHISAAADNFFGTVIGRATHGAHPDQGVDPIFIAAQVINALQGVISRQRDPIHPAVVTVGKINGGTAENIIPDDVTMSGTIRSYDRNVREKLWADVEGAFALARAFGGDYRLHLKKGCPSTHNDPKVAALIHDTAVDLFGADRLFERLPSLGGEDFSLMAERAPGAMFMLGAKRDEINRPHHNPLFDLNEGTFKDGAALLAETALRILQGQ